MIQLEEEIENDINQINKVNEFEYGIGTRTAVGVTTNYVDFSVDSNVHYRYKSADDLLSNLDVLAAMIRHHQEHQVPRLETLDAYYKAKNSNILRNRRRKEKDKADHRSAHNFGKVLATFDVGYNTGNPIKIQVNEGKPQDAVDEFNLNNDIDGHNTEIWLDMVKYGRAYEIIHRGKDDEDHIDLSNVFETFVVYDTNVRREPIAAVRYPKTRFGDHGDQIFFQPIVYTADKVVTFDETNLATLELKNPDEQPHEYKEVQITEFAPNRFRMGIYEDVLSLIDLYDAGQSDTANYMTDLNDALLVINGDLDSDKYSTEDILKQRDANILMLESGTDINGNKTSVTAGYIYKQYDVAGVEAYKDRIRADIHEMSMVPDLTDQNFSSNQSGEAMKHKLFGFEQMTSVKQRLFKKGLIRRYRLLFNLRAGINELSNTELNDIKVTFVPNMPKAILEELKALVEAGAEISQETMLGLASFIDSVKDEMERVAEERPSTPKTPDYPEQFGGGDDDILEQEGTGVDPATDQE